MSKEFLDRNLALETVRVTEAAALSSSLHMGRGDEKAADQGCVEAQHNLGHMYFETEDYFKGLEYFVKNNAGFTKTPKRYSKR